MSCQNTPALLAHRLCFSNALEAKVSHRAAPPVSTTSAESVRMALASPETMAQIVTPVST